LFATLERNVVFGLNDFDKTMPGPWEWDVKRLVAELRGGRTRCAIRRRPSDEVRDRRRPRVSRPNE
jgi:hypothetical protein